MWNVHLHVHMSEVRGGGGVGEYLGRIISRCIKNNADLFYLHNVAYVQKHSSSLKCWQKQRLPCTWKCFSVLVCFSSICIPWNTIDNWVSPDSTLRTCATETTKFHEFFFCIKQQICSNINCKFRRVCIHFYQEFIRELLLTL